MPNINYLRGRAHEYRLKDKLEKEGYIVFRTSGSHGIADLIAVKPQLIGDADMFPEVRFIQIKSSIRFREEKMDKKLIDHLVIDWYEFPIKTKEWYAKAKKPVRRIRRLKPKK